MVLPWVPIVDALGFLIIGLLVCGLILRPIGSCRPKTKLPCFLLISLFMNASFLMHCMCLLCRYLTYPADYAYQQVNAFSHASCLRNPQTSFVLKSQITKFLGRIKCSSSLKFGRLEILEICLSSPPLV